ncbi:MAG TPA: hypothetical protein VF708_20585 [Pyrinomonadaceae bacterium]|jgi:hypothetical protein
MVTVLITSFLLIAAISYAFYCWQRTPSERDAEQGRIPPRFGGLFSVDTVEEPQAGRAPVKANSVTSEARAALHERAARSDRTALSDAAACGDAALYDEILNALVERADSDQKLLALVSHITRSEELRVNRRLAEAFIEAWKTSPDRGALPKMLHVAALADDAALYQKAIETAFQFWRERRLAGISAQELRTLMESEYWLLTTGVRNSGAGFVLKLKLAGLRRELAAAIESIQ